MGGTFYRNARTNAVEGQQTAYVNLWDPLAHGHWPGADGRFLSHGPLFHPAVTLLEGASAT